jgi:orotidine-5'-phosphate decarboxylase
VDRQKDAVHLAKELRDRVGLCKVGNQLFTAKGPRVVKKLAGFGFGIFLDLKFHDIPNTVAHGVASAAKLDNVELITLHTTGGMAMMRAAREAAGDKKNRPRLLGVTVLTSMDDAALAQVGIQGPVAARALALAKLAKSAGLDGVVASAHEVKAIRQACGKDFLIVVPGIRPATSSTDDQARVATPKEAIAAGADYLVIGRPITAANNPRKAAANIAEEIASAL